MQTFLWRRPPGFPVVGRWFFPTIVALESVAHRTSFIALDKSVLYNEVRTISEQVGTNGVHSSEVHADKRREVHPAQWFGDFYQSESSYDVDGVPKVIRTYEPSSEAKISSAVLPTFAPLGINAQWFQESNSGGPLRAWQTSYPAVTQLRPRAHVAPEWVQATGATTIDADIPEMDVANAFRSNSRKGAAWFESSVGDYDAFGRVSPPSAKSPKRYVGWEKRRRNVTLECGPPGCMANASMRLFNYETEEHQQCLLTISLHPTDFDDEYSHENVEWTSVNGFKVSARCVPTGSGCDAAARGRLEPCIADFPLVGLLGNDGVVNVSAKLSPMVDECPVNGKLLSGIALVSCLIRPRGEAYPVTSLDTDEELDSGYTGSTALRCNTPGCIAYSAVVLKKDDFVNRICEMTVTIWQTDFDGDQHSVEEVEWVKIDGTMVVEHKAPGKNPCKGNTTREMFVLVDGRNVDLDVADGHVDVSVKISNMVDECGHDGFLVDAKAEVNCRAS